MEEQSHKQIGRMKEYCGVPLRHTDHHPQHHSCLQKTKHPEAALSAEVSVWQGPRRDTGGAPGLLPLSLPLAQLSAQPLRLGAAGHWAEHGELLERPPGERAKASCRNSQPGQRWPRCPLWRRTCRPPSQRAALQAPPALPVPTSRWFSTSGRQLCGTRAVHQYHALHSCAGPGDRGLAP